MQNNITVVIVDDNPDDLKRIAGALQVLSARVSYKFDIIPVSDPDQAVQYEAQWYILDIVMGETNGFDLAVKIKEKTPDVCIMFCTTHDDLVFESFNIDVFYFIRKEHLDHDMVNALHKYPRYQQKNESYYTLRHKGGTVLLKQIVYFESSGNDMYIHLSDGSEIIDRCSISQLVKELPAGRYLHISRNFLVSCDYVATLVGQTLTIKDGTKFTIVKDRLPGVKRDYLNYLAWR